MNNVAHAFAVVDGFSLNNSIENPISYTWSIRIKEAVFWDVLFRWKSFVQR